MSRVFLRKGLRFRIANPSLHPLTGPLASVGGSCHDDPSPSKGRSIERMTSLSAPPATGQTGPRGFRQMVERRIELNRRYHRKKKLKKLKAKLATATANKDTRERERILGKIHLLSPWWKEPAPQAST